MEPAPLVKKKASVTGTISAMLKCMFFQGLIQAVRNARAHDIDMSGRGLAHIQEIRQHGPKFFSTRRSR